MSIQVSLESLPVFLNGLRKVNKNNAQKEATEIKPFIQEAKEIYGYDRPEGSFVRLNYYI